MEWIFDKKTKSGKLVMTGALTIDRVREIRDALDRRLGEVKTLLVDVGQASEVDLAFLQLMCSAHRTAVGMNKSFSLSGKDNPAMQKAIAENSYARETGCRLDETKTCLWMVLKNA